MRTKKAIIIYQGGYKYQLKRDYVLDCRLELSDSLASRFIKIEGGRLVILAGYAWDGPSGPSIDTPNFMRGSLVHDALYQLIREGRLPKKRRKLIDRLLFDICIADGMTWLRAKWVYHAVRSFGWMAARK